MKALLILNDATYGSERTYTIATRRSAREITRSPGPRLPARGRAGCVKAGQKVLEGFCNIQLMLDQVVRHKGEIGACGTCWIREASGQANSLRVCTAARWTSFVQWTAWRTSCWCFDVADLEASGTTLEQCRRRQAWQRTR